MQKITPFIWFDNRAEEAARELWGLIAWVRKREGQNKLRRYANARKPTA